ncbi:MAG: hypothetical protein GX617_13050, partial [Lentisphaerae bacterium]|nr:hypothetical protein [Lentisphaerota bacterium]
AFYRGRIGPTTKDDDERRRRKTTTKDGDERRRRKNAGRLRREFWRLARARQPWYTVGFLALQAGFGGRDVGHCHQKITTKKEFFSSKVFFVPRGAKDGLC